MRRDIFGLGAAQLVLTARWRSADWLSRPACSTGAARWWPGSRWRCRRPRSRCRFSRSADDLQHALRPARLRDPAVPGHGGGAAAGAAAAARAGRRRPKRTASPTPRLRRAGRRAIAAHGARRALSAQSVLPPARRDRRARGDDRGRAAGRARRGAADADGRHVDGARRVSRRRAARRVRTTATSSKPTSSRSAACCWRCSSWASA